MTHNPSTTAEPDSNISTRSRTSFNAGWRFHQGEAAPPASDLPAASLRKCAPAFRDDPPERETVGINDSAAPPFAAIECDDSGWQSLTLPHDWAIAGPFKQEYPGDTGKLPWQGVGWYRKSFTFPEADGGRRCYLDFDGAMSHAAVWVNGHFAGGWPYGYASFRIDLTPYLKIGEKNLVAVRLENPPESSRWYPGAGIYRNTWLVKAGPTHIAQWGVFVSTPKITPAAATAAIRVKVENHSQANVPVEVTTEFFLLSPEGKVSSEAVAATYPQKVIVGAHSFSICSTATKIPNPALWNLSAPNRYLAVTAVSHEGKLIDRHETPFGIRSIAFDAEKGFLLNGDPVRMNGVCQHHDLGALGAAVHRRALERQVEILREMGVNAIRTSHNPPAPELLDICDRLGLLVIDEAFDAWAMSKRENDYARLFPDWHEADLRALIRRDRNHPCVVLWSTGNEIGEQGNTEGHALSRKLTAIVKSEDPTRPLTVGCHFPEAGFNGFHETIDVFGFNYKPHLYGEFREKSPHIPFYGSETASTISSRGEYFFPVSEEKSEGQANFQVSSYDLYTPRWAMRPDEEFAGLDRFPSAFGEFVWTGFDYIGEPTPYNTDSTLLLNFSNPKDRRRAEKEIAELGKLHVPARSSYFGIVDLAGFRKDRFYLYQSRWRPDLPIAHILPHWTWPERVGEITPVHVYTSGDEAELFLNGSSLGRKKKERYMYRIRWDDVVYEPGELKVIAYKNGEKWAEGVQLTTGPATALRLVADRSKIRAVDDLSFVTASVIDKDGLVVPRSHHPIAFSIKEPGEIVATDNGNPIDHEPFPSRQRNAFNGLALAIVRSRGDPGSFILRAESPGLDAAEIVIEAVE